MADTPEHPTTIAETQSQFLARALLTLIDDLREFDREPDREWTDADQSRLRALADGTGY